MILGDAVSNFGLKKDGGIVAAIRSGWVGLSVPVLMSKAR